MSSIFKKYSVSITGSLSQVESVVDFAKRQGLTVKPPRCLESYNCRDCGSSAQSYMVNDEVWKEAGLLKSSNCCLRCLEIRLGRKLSKSDLINAPINDLALHSFA